MGDGEEEEEEEEEKEEEGEEEEVTRHMAHGTSRLTVEQVTVYYLKCPSPRGNTMLACQPSHLPGQVSCRPCQVSSETPTRQLATRVCCRQPK